MESYDQASMTKALYESGRFFFTTKTLRDLLGNASDDVFFAFLRKACEAEVLTKIERNKYVLVSKKSDAFALSYALYSPSYISFESALNFHGILSQFPLEITAATTRKSMQKTVTDRVFSYVHLPVSLFWGYEQYKEGLLASPEKAFLDQAYLTSRGAKGLPLDEYDLSRIDKKTVRAYLSRYPQARQMRAIQKKIAVYF